jgi:hypothetical protein
MPPAKRDIGEAVDEHDSSAFESSRCWAEEIAVGPPIKDTGSSLYPWVCEGSELIDCHYGQTRACSTSCDQLKPKPWKSLIYREL